LAVDVLELLVDLDDLSVPFGRGIFGFGFLEELPGYGDGSFFEGGGFFVV